MKIIYVIWCANRGGGAVIVEIVKANALAGKGHEVILCCSHGVDTDKTLLRVNVAECGMLLCD
jgi:hypothetical protein